tara:strand:- start:10267 stop:11148 length:882 start_codon:yes stop_codon:yes gene_type:complete
MSIKLKQEEFLIFKSQFKKEGFCILKSFFSEKEITDLESVVSNLYLLQAKKIGDYKDLTEGLSNSDISNFEKFSAISKNLELKDKEALYQVQKFLEISPKVRSIFDNNFFELCSSLMNSKLENILLNGPALFVNNPSNDRLLYKWHSEVFYYPKRRNFLNIWFPLFSDKDKNNGTMKFKVKTHKHSFPFSEYQGYEVHSDDKKKSFIQYEIPDNFLVDFEEFFCEVSRRDLVIFDKNLVHTSTINNSKKVSASVVAKVWDPENDLTLSGNLDSKTYKNDIGRSNLIVKSKLDD